jgi:F420-non-reducing hydrogenase iron-sulfur subunit
MKQTFETASKAKPKILLVAMARSSYLAADALGQLHLEYPASVYIIKTLYPGILPSYFYVETFLKGMDGIIIAAAGADCPIEESYKQLATNVQKAHEVMTQKEMNVKRLRLTAICSVCTTALLKEINQMSEFITKEKQEGKL